jgi:hypothetical protein
MELEFTPTVIDIPNDRRVMATTMETRNFMTEWGDLHPFDSRGCKALVTRATRYVAEGRPVMAYIDQTATGELKEMYVIEVSTGRDRLREIIIYVDSDESRMDNFDLYYRNPMDVEV